MFQRLVPSPATVDAATLAADDRAPRGARPWVGVCMVASLDGAMTVEDRSQGLSGDGDRALFQALRAAADVVVVGAGTARAEGYGLPRRAGQRVGVVTASGAIDVTTPLFASGTGFLIMADDGPDAPRRPDGAAVDVVRAGRGRIDLAGALERLGDVTGPVRFVQAEGGPSLNAAMVDADCVDELNLTISPRLTGGSAARIVDGAHEAIRDFELRQLATDDDGFVYGRWRRRQA